MGGSHTPTPAQDLVDIQPGDRLLVEVEAKEAYAEDCCVRVEAGTQGFLQSLWLNRRSIIFNITRRKAA